MVHPFRFGVVAEHFESASTCLAKARKAEEYGYFSFLVPHHIFHSPFVLLTAAALATSSIKVGSFVFNIDMIRDPVFLATEAASLDQISNGRLELGLGPGYTQEEYRQVGISFDPVTVRIERFIEALHIIKGLLESDQPLRFPGVHYNIDYQMQRNLPLQRPYPPIYIGGGAKRMLSLAAREADIVGIVPVNSSQGLESASITDAATEQKVAWVRQAAGDRISQIQISTMVFHVTVTDADPLRVAERVSIYLGKHLFAPQQSTTPQEILSSPHFLIGSVDQICELLLDRRDKYGMSYITVLEKDMEQFAPVVASLSGK